ncbi:hypothetical protein ACRQTN_05160 [Pectobacterium brasiliense]|uniref:hypothetical protein n=1 Tax=Pectobacterium brasiliense TaxID=180957 RepID=UPI003EB7FF87
MAKHLTKEEIQSIINIIAGWNSNKLGKLTWEALCDYAADFISKRPTRQSLSFHGDIVAAFNVKKNNIKSGLYNLKRPANLNVAAQHIQNIETKKLILEEQYRELKQMMVLWQYNAYILGINESQLNKPLPGIDRERSK